MVQNEHTTPLLSEWSNPQSPLHPLIPEQTQQKLDKIAVGDPANN